MESKRDRNKCLIMFRDLNDHARNYSKEKTEIMYEAQPLS